MKNTSSHLLIQHLVIYFWFLNTTGATLSLIQFKIDVSVCVLVYLFVPIASISSMKTMEGACSSATLNSSRTSLGPSPRYFWISSEPTTRRKVADVWLATALASSVLPGADQTEAKSAKHTFPSISLTYKNYITKASLKHKWFYSSCLITRWMLLNINCLSRCRFYS